MDAGKRVLGAFPETLGAAAMRRLVSDGGLHRSGIQCVGDDWLGADFLQYGCGIARLCHGEYLVLIRS